MSLERMLAPTQGQRSLRRDTDLMARNPTNLQDAVLNQIRKDNIPVTVYLVNGVQLKGVVRAFDNFTVMLEYESRQLMVYKHAISTVSPVRAVNYGQPSSGRSPAPAGPENPPTA
jgi:host factor-I protein